MDVSFFELDGCSLKLSSGSRIVTGSVCVVASVHVYETCLTNGLMTLA